MKEREIKFRAWVKRPEGCYMAIQGTPDLETLQSFMFHYGDQELEQFTGLKDVHGQNIYEGDILFDGTYKDVVVYDNDYAAFTISYGQNYGMIESSDVQIIGNIHENRDLL